MEFDVKFQGYSIQIIVVSVLGIILFAAGLVTTAAYAFVKITSPVKSQNVPVGNILISGVSSSNSINHCVVSVIINGIRPYQRATSTGINGPMDYSKWTFIATPAYTTVKEGMNKITAKYSCLPEVNFTKFYSINVTGTNVIVPKQFSAIEGSNTAVAPLLSNSSSYLFHPTPLINHLSLPTNSNSSPSSEDHSRNSGGYCSYSDYKSNVKSCG